MMVAKYLPERAAENFSALIDTDSQSTPFVRINQRIRKLYVKESLKTDDIAIEKEEKSYAIGVEFFEIMNESLQ